MNLRAILANLRGHVDAVGPLGYAQHEASLLVDRWFDWRLGIDTRRPASMLSLGIDNPESVDYVPIPYLALRSALRRVAGHMTPSSCFLDYGAGRGRVLVTAARLPFRSVIGVELSQELAAQARLNLASARGLKCHHAEVHHGDAAEFCVPDEVDFVHLFNPFGGATLRRVFENLRSSFERARRPITIVYFNDEALARALPDHQWLERVEGGLVLRRTMWPISWGIYRSRRDPAG